MATLPSPRSEAGRRARSLSQVPAGRATTREDPRAARRGGPAHLAAPSSPVLRDRPGTAVPPAGLRRHRRAAGGDLDRGRRRDRVPAPMGTPSTRRRETWPVQVALSEQAAAAPDLEPGDRFGGGPVRQGVDVQISGIYSPDDPDDPAWTGARNCSAHAGQVRRRDAYVGRRRWSRRVVARPAARRAVGRAEPADDLPAQPGAAALGAVVGLGATWSSSRSMRGARGRRLGQRAGPGAR